MNAWDQFERAGVKIIHGANEDCAALAYAILGVLKIGGKEAE